MDQLVLLAQVHKLEAEMEPLDTASIVAHAQQRLAGVIEEHDARVIVPDTWPVALGQSSWVEEVWVNCLHDAIRDSKSTPPTLELDATALPDGMVQFWIKDNGRRAEPGEHDPLFDPLPQRRKGYGLRMSLARRIVDRLGGHTEVESNAGQTLYTFTLPGLEYQNQS
jgi:signal transduction histidine kinase